MDSSIPSTVHPKRANRTRQIFVRQTCTKVSRLPIRPRLLASPKTAKTLQLLQAGARKSVAKGARTENLTSLLGLPRELRDEIYEWAMVDLPSRIYIPKHEVLSQLVFLPKTLPQMCFVNKQMLSEVRLSFIRRTRFRLEDDATAQIVLSRWLAQFPNGQGFQAIRFVTYDRTKQWYSDSSRPDSYLHGFVSKCEGLRSLEINVTLRLWQKRGMPKEVLDTTEKFRLARRWGPFFELNLSSLRHLKIGCRLSHLDVIVHEDNFSALLPIFIQMFEDGFLVRKSGVQKKQSSSEFYHVCEWRWSGPK